VIAGVALVKELGSFPKLMSVYCFEIFPYIPVADLISDDLTL